MDLVEQLRRYKEYEDSVERDRRRKSDVKKELESKLGEMLRKMIFEDHLLKGTKWKISSVAYEFDLWSTISSSPRLSIFAELHNSPFYGFEVRVKGTKHLLRISIEPHEGDIIVMKFSDYDKGLELIDSLGIEVFYGDEDMNETVSYLKKKLKFYSTVVERFKKEKEL